LAWLQAVAWLCDIIENIYLFKRIKPQVTASSLSVHRTYQAVVILKWGICLTGAISAIFGLLYFWLIGDYFYYSLHYFLIIIAEVLLFVIAGKIIYETF